MTKKTIFAVIALVCATVMLSVSSCSADEDPNSEVFAENPLALAMVQAMEQSGNSGEERYVFYSSTDGIQIMDKSAFTLGKMFEQVGDTFEEVTFSFNSKDAIVRDTRGVVQEVSVGKWIYAGRTTTSKVNAMKFAYKLATNLPSDREINIKIVPVLNEKKEVIGYDVYYQIV